MSTATTSPITGTWELDKIHSTFSFAVKHMVVSTFRGRFDDVDATLADGRLVGTARVDSVDVKDDNLKGHLTAPDFFDAERYPEIRYESGELRIEGDQVVADGELTIKGNTRPVEARGTISGPAVGPDESNRLGVSLEAVVDRREFGLDWNAELPKGGFALGDDVRITVDLEFAGV